MPAVHSGMLLTFGFVFTIDDVTWVEGGVRTETYLLFLSGKSALDVLCFLIGLTDSRVGSGSELTFR